LKTREMIKELTENPEKRFHYNTGSESGVIENIQGDIMVAERSCKPHKPSELILHRGFMKIDWELVREPVNFMTAINSGKRIKPWGTTFAFMDFGQVLFYLGSANVEVAFKQINGKWLIE